MTARIILSLVMLVIAGGYLSWRMIGTGKGQHAAPRRFIADDERLALPHERTIPRAITEHDPPWEYQAAPVIEPDAITSGPPDEPQPDAWIVATATLCGGQVTSVQYAAGTAAYVDEKIRTGMGLPPWVAEELGHDSTDDALDSMFNRAMARQVRALTDGAP